jgi:hypothetical protein
MLGVSHGALQFMTYEEMKNAYNSYRKLPIDNKLVRILGISKDWEIFGARAIKANSNKGR